VAIQRVRLFVSGRVQGVCFRYYTREQASALGVTGFVRNLYDGRVEVVAEGAAEAIERLVLWCHEGPSMANVIEIEISREEPSGEFTSFRVEG